ncbi:uncharacterized protein LOC127839294 [Dreissena polymorpha]|uniref:G-protein coupled receptors family 1 profile domain-containing protein n=1 Tax=Dreissena polymorpha TaxID=45954 RepID=A0A9D4F9S5_DREPO|nr:uncharacterized protein LOC127839294 [Dreissena polymorpha]KAH3791897.1 hypothetical protein DPMN_145388 [Dreissena polymorpha]
MNTSAVESVVTCEPYNFLECHLARWIWRILPGLCICVGTIGNLLNVIILKRLNLRRFPRNIFLVFLAVSDATFLWTFALNDVLFALHGYTFLEHGDVLCRTTWFVGYTAGAFSTWVLVLLTMERTLALKAPVFSRKMLTMKNCNLACGVTLTVIAVLNCNVLYGFDYKDYAHGEQLSPEFQNVTKIVASDYPCFFVSKGYMDFYYTKWNIISMTLYFVIPIVFSIVGNINIAMVIVLRRRKTAKNKVPDMIFTLTSSAREYGKSTDGTCNSSTDFNYTNVILQNTNFSMVGTINSDRDETQLKTDLSTSNTKPTRDGSFNRHDTTITKSESKKKKRKGKRGQHATRLLFCICVSLILTSIPCAVYEVIRGHLEDVSPKVASSLQLSRAVTHSLLYMNFALNFFFYFVSGTLFKNEWKKMVRQTRQSLKRLHIC